MPLSLLFLLATFPADLTAVGATLKDNSLDSLTTARAQGAAIVASAYERRLPFLLAAGLVDGLTVTEDPERALALWSLLLDHGYVLAPAAGPNGRLVVACPGDSLDCVAKAIRARHTVASTGPDLAVTMPKPDRLDVRASARDGALQRVELWSHNRVIAAHDAAGPDIEVTLPWSPSGPGDWVAVRVVAQHGWAISAAFFAQSAPATPLQSEMRLVFPEISSQQQAGGRATVWDRNPSLPGAVRLREVDLERNELAITVPPAALIRLEMSDGRGLDVRPYVVSGVRTLLESLAPEALLSWAPYDEVRRRLRRISFESHF
ncbi:MAG: hypothetical protein K2X03_23900 [Bryobacteraceae bacterium]|nr:hypothetical protein [Bryobacteraceae bacterium]